VRARAGQRLATPLAASEIRTGAGPGLVVVGSHVPTTTRQLAALLADPPVRVKHIEVPVAEVAEVADPRRRRALLRRTVAQAARALDEGAVPVVATSREVVAPAANDPTGLGLARSLSRALAGVVRALEPRPAWILAKGGITSSDVATRGLGAASATVVGPLLPGVPVWRVARAGAATVLLVVFPGNVGDDDALRAAVARLSEAAE
jgi:uncharacterized protein YgbK (DUF1537 family)